MIGKEEIDAKAREFQIHPANVQRDYIFGWILFGLFTVSEMRGKVFLKGGNALRKGYFANTRYSADLDFGTPGEINQDEVLAEFSKIGAYIQSQTGVVFLSEAHRIGEWYPASQNVVTELKVYDVRLYFQDFYGNADHIKIRVSIDFTRYDRVLLPLQTKPLIHPYSDAHVVGCNLQCMKLEEIIATKLKCLLQRQHAPDLFDYVYSIKLLGGNLNRRELVTTFIKKTIFDKNPHFVKELLLKSPLGFFRSMWQQSIICAKQVAIGVEDAISFYLNDLNDLFAIFPGGRFNSFEYFGPHLRNPIMEAGRNLTCLAITYDAKKRLVEPYALKYMERKDGTEREYLYVYDRDGGNSGPGPKTLVAEKISSIEVTDRKFEPRWPVELCKSGELPDQHYFFDPNRPHKSPSRSTSRHGLIYSYKCSHCGKHFSRQRMDSKLNAHKDKRGNRCFGTYGIYSGSRFK
jgi:predicted nucleotidyltransferase component of viral defense system